MGSIVHLPTLHQTGLAPLQVGQFVGEEVGAFQHMLHLECTQPFALQMVSNGKLVNVQAQQSDGGMYWYLAVEVQHGEETSHV